MDVSNYVKGNKTLASILGVTEQTICAWRKEGVFEDAIISEFRRTIIYDLPKVYACLRHDKVTRGRKKERV